MKPKKRFLLAALLVVLALVLAACSPEGPSTSTAENSTPSGETGTESDAGTETSGSSESSSPSDPTAAERHILVAYFSHTGNTESVARQIADLTGGTLAEIQRTEEYGNLQEEAEAEILEDARPPITVGADNIQDYDTIFVGYPIWWDEAPAMIATFLGSYDFAGKTLIPFCTSASDSIDNSLHIFREICPDAVIAEGLTANNEGDIEPWLQRLGLLQETP